MLRRTSLLSLGICAVLAGCGGPTPSQAPGPAPSVPVPPPAPSEPRDPLAEVPPRGITPDAPFPAIVHRELPNGLKLRIVPRKLYPLVEFRLVVFSGQSSDGDKPGLAVVAGEMLKAGGAGPWDARQLLEQAESLGADLNVITDRDATRVSLGVTTANITQALALLGAVAEKPRFSPAEFAKLKQREIERVKSAARASAGWAASMVLYRELYELPTSVHPYARYDALPGDLEKLTVEHCRAWYRQHFTPKNAVLVITGDVDPDAIEKQVAEAFRGWKGERPPPVSYPEPMPDADKTIYVVDRPGSGQSQIYVGLLGPERQSEDWPSLAATNQILGGGVAGRLFMDVREKRSLAYSTGSSVEEPAHARVPIVLSAGTQTAKTAQAVQALLENLEKIGSSAPSDAELETASRYLSDSFLFRMETASAIAELTTRLAVLGLPDDYYDDYRRAVRKLDPVRVGKTAEQYFKTKGAVIVVAGDASKVAKPLTHFGKVSIIDPEQAFTPGQQLPHDPSQKID